MTVGGVVLCGGRSSRMGRPKAWLPFGDELMLQRVVRVLGGAVGPVVVVAAPDQDIPPLPDEVVIARDDIEGRGPLQGLDAGLAALDGRTDAVYLSSCDVPFLRAAFVRRVVSLLGDHAAAVPDVGGYQHPLAAVYRVSVLPEVRRRLAANLLRATALFDTIPTRLIEAQELVGADPALESLRNLNTEAEYAAAVQTWAGAG